MSPPDVLQLYRDAWNERDEPKRAACLDLILHNHTVLFHALGRIVGSRPIAHFIGDLHAKIPFDRFEYTTLPQQHDHGAWLRIHWGVWLVSGATPNAEGLDVMEFDDDGRLRQIISFNGRVMSATSVDRKA